MNRLDINWKPTRYRSRHPSWAGHDLVVLPHMGYLICNGMVWSRWSWSDFAPSETGEIRKMHTLNEMINPQVIHEKHEIYMYQCPALGKHRRTVGLRGLSCEIDTISDIQSGYYNVHEDIMHHAWSRQLTDCSTYIQSKTRIIQNYFKRRNRSLYLHNIRKIKTLQDVATKLPTEVIKYITELFVKNPNISDMTNRKQHPLMLMIETNL